MKLILHFLFFGLVSTLVLADTSGFGKGPVIAGYGPVATVPGVTLPAQLNFKVAFDVSERGPDDAVSRDLEKLARFLNLHGRAGIAPDRMQLALVVHGKAGYDLLSDADYQRRFGTANPNTGLLAALSQQGVTIQLCGQSAAYYDINADQLAPGVNMALSAMTAHALLQQQGYTLNPF